MHNVPGIKSGCVKPIHAVVIVYLRVFLKARFKNIWTMGGVSFAIAILFPLPKKKPTKGAAK